MFIEQGIHKENKFWKYIIGSLLIILASSIGQIPLFVSVMAKSFSEGKAVPSDQNDLLKVFNSNLTLFLIMLSFAFAVCGIYFVIRYLHSQSMMSIVTSRSKIDWNRIGFSFGVMATLTIISTVIEYYLNPSDFAVNFNLLPFVCLFFIATIMIPIQTSCEELVFRGYLMQGF